MIINFFPNIHKILKSQFKPFMSLNNILFNGIGIVGRVFSQEQS